MSSHGNPCPSEKLDAATSRLSLLDLAGGFQPISNGQGCKISLLSKTPNTREFMLEMLDHKACFCDSPPQAGPICTKGKRSRALLEKEMYQHANKLSFPSTASIPSGGRVEWETTATDNALCWTLDAHGKQAVVVVVDVVLNGAQSAKHTKHLQSTYLRACWDEHELESEIRVSPSRCSWDKQSRLLRLKHARTTAEIACYDTVISMEQLVPSNSLDPLSEGDDSGESDGYFSDESLPSSE
ncbi:hypothetical protein FIBSPDRAFT_900272 [Athelia psychrophila]|uniref:Uncharacterized protein n=1 Tax=Athelia psychrophila TaxID=1759441 RepID=A0A165YP66_9AGAM|nr:hypothetical protein FIBSPDRAFT_900272 [Fibularhizoctonia sp. CBS 109695]